MTWADFNLICFATGFGFSFFFPSCWEAHAPDDSSAAFHGHPGGAHSPPAIVSPRPEQ